VQEGDAGDKESVEVEGEVGIGVGDIVRDDVECMEMTGREEDEINEEGMWGELRAESEEDRAIGAKGEAAW